MFPSHDMPYSEENLHGLKVVGVQPEFRRIFQNLEIQRLQIHESEEGALSSFVFEAH